MARVEGQVDSVIQFMEEGISSTLIHIHSKGLCYSVVFHGSQAVAINILLKKGDRVAFTGPISVCEDNGIIISRDIDASSMEVEHKGVMQPMKIDYQPQYTPVTEWSGK